MLVFCSANNIAPRSSSAAYNSAVGAGRVKDEETVEILGVPDEEVLHGRKVSVPSLDPQKYNHKEL